jgi:tetratricopeptide (TPR) repeat protein
LVDNDKHNSTAYFLLGCIFEKKNELEKSIDFFNRAIDADPNNINALFSRGACYNRLGYFQKAIDDYYLAIEKDSQKGLMRKQNIRNIGKMLGLNNMDNAHTIDDRRDSNLDKSKISEHFDVDIQHYVYSNVDIKNTIDSLSSSIQKQSKKNIKLFNEGPQEISIDIFKTNDKYEALKNNEKKDNYIKIQKVEYNNKFGEQFEEYEDGNFHNNDIKQNIENAVNKERKSSI